MANVKFYLKNPKARKQSLVYLVLNFDYQRLKLSTGISVPPKYWYAKNKCVRELVEYPESTEINLRLKEMEAGVLSCYHNLRKKRRSVGVEELKSMAEKVLKSDYVPKSDKGFWEHFDDFVDSKRDDSYSKDVRDYDNSLRKHLLATEKILKTELSLEIILDIDIKFVKVWESYLFTEAINAEGKKGLRRNTVGKQNKNLKVFLKWCFKRKIVDEFDLGDFKTYTEDVDDVYLTKKDLTLLCELGGLDEDERHVRDLFVCGCETALRIGDLRRLKREHFINGELHIRANKNRNKPSGRKLIIPISERLDGVLQRYSYSPPPYPKSLKESFNTVLREVCKKAGITYMVSMEKNINGELKEFQIEKYTQVSSHTARRTFCTLKYLAKMPTQSIMKFSGHTTEKSFLRYLKLDAETNAEANRDFF